MQSVDFAAVISAAAGSSLGVLSLLALVVSLLAWGFFRGSGDTIKLWVFGAMLVAAIGFGVSVVRESDGDPHGRPGPGIATGTISQAPSMTSAASDRPAAVAPATQAGTPAAAAFVTASMSALADGGDAAIAQAIVGDWRDEDGFTYRFAADANRIRFTQFQGGAKTGSAVGSIAGGELRYRYGVNSQDGNTGTCVARPDPDGDRISGTCTSGGSSWPFAITRVR